MKEYPQYPHAKFGSRYRAPATPPAADSRAGSSSARLENDPNAYLYFIAQAPVWKDICKVIGKEAGSLIRTTPRPMRACRADGGVCHGRSLDDDKNKFEAMAELNQHDIPCGPILSMEELAGSLRCAPPAPSSRSIIQARQVPDGGQSDQDVRQRHGGQALPLLGEHTQEVLTELGLSESEIKALRTENVI